MRKSEALLAVGFVLWGIAGAVATCAAAKFLHSGFLVSCGIGFAAGFVSFVCYVIVMTKLGH